MRLLLLLLLILLSAEGNAQFLDKHAIYLNGNGVLGNYSGGRAGLNYMYKEQYSVQISSSAVLRSAKSKPVDYTMGFVELITLGLLQPYDQIDSYEFLVGKVKVLNQKGTVRFNLRGGLTYATVTEPTNYQRFNNGGFVANYTFDYEKKNAVGAILNPTLEFPFSRFFGVSLAPLILINKETVAVGLEIGTMLGVLRKNPGANNN